MDGYEIHSRCFSELAGKARQVAIAYYGYLCVLWLLKDGWQIDENQNKLLLDI